MDIITRINWVDVVIAVIALRIVYTAFADGLSHQIFPFLGSIAMAVLGLRYYTVLGSFISRVTGGIPLRFSEFIAFIMIVTALAFAIRFIKKVIDIIVKVEWHPLIERFGGIIAGIGRAYLIVSIVLIILVLAPVPYLQSSVIERSLMGRHILMGGAEVYEKASAVIPALKGADQQITKSFLINELFGKKEPQTKQKKRSPLLYTSDTEEE